jgi:plastocyanin
MALMYSTMHFTVCREYKIQVKDNKFEPQIILIEEGDRIWWEWKQEKVFIQHFWVWKHSPDQIHDWVVNANVNAN